jgi:MFS family permease
MVNAQLMRRQVLRLATAQALFQTVSVMVMTIGGLAGALVSPRPEWATAPIAAMFLGTALTTVPAALWMNRVGRRTGFLAGALLGVSAGIVAAGGVWLGSLLVLCAGTLLVGAYQAFAQFYRFAAGEVADDAYRPRAISLVLAGGVVAALLGPLLARLGGPLLEPAYTGSFLLLAAASLLALGVLFGLKMPHAATVPTGSGEARPLRAIVRQPAYIVALVGASTGYGVMILAMTATPVAMVHHQHTLADTTLVIQLHVLAMFLPSFVTGTLIARFGVLQVMLAGVVLLAGHVVATLTGVAFSSFATALVLLGVGWNFLYVGGTTLLTSTYRPAERGRAQATNDLVIFATGLVSSLVAGALLSAIGWQSMNLMLLPWLAAAALAILGLAWRRRVDVRRVPKETGIRIE